MRNTYVRRPPLAAPPSTMRSTYGEGPTPAREKMFFPAWVWSQ